MSVFSYNTAIASFTSGGSEVNSMEFNSEEKSLIWWFSQGRPKDYVHMCACIDAIMGIYVHGHMQLCT